MNTLLGAAIRRGIATVAMICLLPGLTAATPAAAEPEAMPHSAPQDHGETGAARAPWESAQWQEAVGALERCLAAPSRACALSSVLMVTAQQDLAIDRVDNLITLGRSFIAIGDEARARRVLALAEKAAEGIGIGLATERKLAEIAAIYGLLGDRDAAERLFQRITDATTVAQARLRLAENLARAHEADAALAVTAAISKPWLALDALDRVIRELAERDGSVSEALIARFERRIEELPRYILSDLARAHLALLFAKRGETARAEALLGPLDARLSGRAAAADEVRLAAALLPVDRALGKDVLARRHLGIIEQRADQIGLDDDRRRVFAEAAVALALAGREEAAEKILARAGEEYRLLLETAAALVEAGAPASLLRRAAARVRGALARQELRAERDRGRLAAVDLLVAAGALEEALALVRAVEDPGLKARALAMAVPLLS